MKGIGQNFDSFMMEQGLYDEAMEIAAKKMIALQIEKEMQKQKLTKTSLAHRLRTSRAAVDNILNPRFNTSIASLEKFANALGKHIKISLEA
ncbi:MAG: helix-turn-helix domain-containing protein [Spirochaetaceae bacterium]|jgi:predicted XRE-type DNA-binding protein|nr:helix-turn-helix domain-containing protein [Spirochaetaceae bacterium]